MLFGGGQHSTIPEHMAPERSPKAIVFDLDGTLVDSRRDIVTAVNHALVVHGLPTQPPELLVTFVGDGARWLVARASGLPYDDPALDPVLTTYSEYYTAHPLGATRTMPFVRRTLSALKRLPLAVCTNKPRATTELVLGGLGLLPFFTTVVAGGDVPRLKPDPLPLLTIAQRLRIEARALVMVGDGPQDLACGRAAGAFTVGIQGGMTAPERLVEGQPDALLDSMADLPTLVESWGTELDRLSRAKR